MIEATGFANVVDFIDVEINEPVDFVLVVENVAADTIRTIEFECDYGNGKKDTTIIEVEIPYLAVDSVVYADLLFDSIGKYTVKFTALQLNGEEDLTPEQMQEFEKWLLEHQQEISEAAIKMAEDIF